MSLRRARQGRCVESFTMTARHRSKKATKSKTKKTGPASSVKPASKRTSKEASSSIVRSRVGKSKPASNARVRRKTIRAKMNNVVAKPSKRKRKSSDAGTASRAQSAAKRLAKAASAKKAGASKSPSKAVRAANAAKAASVTRARSKEPEIKAAVEHRGAPEARMTADKGTVAPAGLKPSHAHSVHTSADSTELASPPKSVAPTVKVQKAGASEEASQVAKSLKTAGQRQGFKLSEFVVYPAHGVGQIVAIEEQEVAGFKLELFVISFSKDKLTLRVPTSKVSGVGMRKISDPDTARRSLEILTGRARVKRTMWSRRAQEYESKINSGDINAIAEVVRDLYRSEAQPEQSYSERQLYEAALDRIVREIAAVQKSTEIDALKTVEAQLQKGQSRTSKSAGPQSAASEIEQAA
jgi:CarD family transcriptional regulator, regulator of rRNA transcription